MKFVFVTRDVGNGDSLKAIAREAEAGGHQTTLFLGEGKPFSPEAEGWLAREIPGADRLVVSLSSSAERTSTEKIALEIGAAHDVPVTVVSDMYGMIHRSQWIGEAINKARLLTVVAENECASARSYVSDTTRIVVAPNPNWASYFDPSPRDDIPAVCGVRPGARVLLVTGSKERDRNAGLLHSLQAVLPELHEVVRVIITSHPGADHTMESLEIIGDTPRVFFLPKEKGVPSTFDLIDRCAHVVVTSGASTITLMGAAKQVPVVDLMHRRDMQFWGALSGLNFWPPAREGISLLATTTEEFRESLWSLMGDPTRVEGLRARQAVGFTREMCATAARTILQNIIAL